MDLINIYNNYSNNVVSLFGSNITYIKKELINNLDLICIVCDNDKAGLKWIEEFRNFYKREFWIAIPKKEGTDAGDLNRQELKECLDNKQLSIDYFFNKEKKVVIKNSYGWGNII
jgi:hypothetical protein